MPPTEKQNSEFALVLIRTVSRRLKLIDEEITAIGTALGQEKALVPRGTSPRRGDRAWMHR